MDGQLFLFAFFQIIINFITVIRIQYSYLIMWARWRFRSGNP